MKITYYFEGKQVEKIDTDKVGTYTIKYVAVDGSGNESFEEVKTVIIIGHFDGTRSKQIIYDKERSLLYFEYCLF